MSDQTIIGTYFNEIKKYPLLTKEEEKQIFTDLNSARDKLLDVINSTSALYDRIEEFKSVLKPGDEIKQYISTYKHPSNASTIVKESKTLLAAYEIGFETSMDEDFPYDIHLALNEITNKLYLNDAFIESLCDDIINSDLNQMFVNDPNIEFESICTIIKENKFKMNQLKQKVVNSNLRLVVSQARSHYKDYAHQTLLDLIQEGSIGLMNAVNRFDHTKGTKFSTLATWWVKQAILRSIQNKETDIRLPVSVQDTTSSIKKFDSEFKYNYDRAPTVSEIAAGVGVPEARVKQLMEMNISYTSSNSTIDSSDSESETIEDTLEDTSGDVEEQLIRSTDIEDVNFALTLLSEEEQEYIKTRFGFNGKAISLQEMKIYAGSDADFIEKNEIAIMEKLKEYMAVIR